MPFARRSREWGASTARRRAQPSVAGRGDAAPVSEGVSRRGKQSYGAGAPKSKAALFSQTRSRCQLTGAGLPIAVQTMEAALNATFDHLRDETAALVWPQEPLHT